MTTPTRKLALRRPVRRAVLGTVGTVAGVVMFGALAGPAQASHHADTLSASSSPTASPTSSGSIPTCHLASLPKETTDTVKLIHSNGPFPYPGKDGSVFTNKEGALPSESANYYHEYTVKTPGASNRGTRRIVTGGTPLTSPPHYYYTGDHYKTYCEIDDAGKAS